jgi:hypothetical protein
MPVRGSIAMRGVNTARFRSARCGRWGYGEIASHPCNDRATTSFTPHPHAAPAGSQPPEPSPAKPAPTLQRQPPQSVFESSLSSLERISPHLASRPDRFQYPAQLSHFPRLVPI